MKFAALAATMLLVPLAGQNDSRPVLSEPSISPDRAEIAFVSGGDIWTVPASGGEARLLVSYRHPNRARSTRPTAGRSPSHPLVPAAAMCIPPSSRPAI